MHDLRMMQKDFQHYLFNESSSIAGHIKASSNEFAISRLEIYRYAYYSRLIEALEQDYNGLHVLLGNSPFDELCRSYIKDYPSHYPSIRWFGQRLPRYIKENALYEERPYLYEMATFEWLLTEAFDSLDCQSVSIEDVARIPPEHWTNMTFQLHSSVRRIAFEWNVPLIYSAMRNKTKKISPVHYSKSVDWIIHREEQETQFYSLSSDQAYMIDAMLQNKNFGAICLGLCDKLDSENIAMHAASLLKKFISDQLIIEVNINNSG